MTDSAKPKARRITRPTGRPVRVTNPTGGGGSHYGGFVGRHTVHGSPYSQRKATR